MKPEFGNYYRDDEGVSELVATILLISLVLIGVAMVATVFFTQPPSVAVPQVQVLAGVNPSNEIFYLYNNGGDSLDKGTFKILVDNGAGYVDRTDEFVIPDVWVVGSALAYDYSGTGISQEDISVNIVYTGEGANALISSTPVSVFVNDSVWGSIVDEGTVTPSFDIEPVTIDNEDEIALGLSEKNGEATIIVSMNESFVADRVDAVLYNYGMMSVPHNAIASSLSLNTSRGYNVWDLMNFNKLSNIITGTPTRVSLNIIAYNFSTSETYTSTFLFDVN